MFYRLEPDVFATYGITGEPALPASGITFLRGVPITEALPSPLVFRSNHPSDSPPRAMAGLSIPVWSADLVQVLRGVGVDNLQLFDAKILGKEPGVEWSGYYAVNVIGLVAAADMAKSKFTHIMSAPSGAPLVAFSELHVDEKKIGRFDLFRVAEDATIVLGSQRVVDALSRNPRPGGWGISAIETGGDAD